MYLKKMCFIFCFLGFFNRSSQHMWSQIKSTVQLSGTIVGGSHAWSSILQTTIFFYLVIRSKISLQYSSKVWLWIVFSVARSHKFVEVNAITLCFRKANLASGILGKCMKRRYMGTYIIVYLTTLSECCLFFVVGFFDMFLMAAAAFRFYLHYYVLSQ